MDRDSWGSPDRGRTTPTPDTEFLITDDGIYIAYQVVGEGPVDIVVGLNSDESNIDLIWEEPDWAPFLVGALDFGRVILHDRRGLGVSSRNVAPPNLETQVSDLLAVLDAARSAQAVLVAGRSGGAMHALFAATHPGRVSGMLWNGPAGRISWAPDYPWGSGPDIFEQDMRDVLLWGTAGYGRSIAEWRAAERAGVPLSDLRPEDVADARRLHAYAKINRNTATPDVAAQIMRIHWETDVRAVLASVQVPTALVVGTDDNVPEAEYVASLLPNATLHVLPGRSGVAVEPIIAILRSLAGVAAPQAGLESVLGTVLFTDIVNSTQKQSAVGNQRWKELLEAHHAVVRGCLARWRGQETDTAGDGFYATFDGPARAIRCGLEIAQQVKVLDIEVRAGVHTGECEVIDGKLGGIAVTTGARISALAAGSQVLVSQTVKDLVAGSGLTFEDAGVHEIKGVPGPWHLYTVTS